MNTYLRERIRADAAHVVNRANLETMIAHHGLRGRFRELLVDGLLHPWLPPYAGCGSGLIVDVSNRTRQSTQEDIVVFDRSLIPPVLAHSTAMEGVFPFDGVLLRVEVKSKLTREGLRAALSAAADISRMEFSKDSTNPPTKPISTIFAFGSDLTGGPHSEFERLISVSTELGLQFTAPYPDPPSPVSALCVVGRGCWIVGQLPQQERYSWMRASMQQDHDEVLLFLGAVSNTCFNVHADRLGRPKDVQTVGGGIGNLILSSDSYEPVPL